MSNTLVDGYVNDSELSMEEFNSTVLNNKQIIKNPGGGNCLFYTLAYLISKTFSDKITHKDVRKKICKYYKDTFRNKEIEALKKLQTGSELEKQLFNLYTFGSVPDKNNNYILEDHNIEHQNKICDDKVWGEEVDIVVACMLYNINIIVFSLLPISKYNPEPRYRIYTYKNNDDYPTCYIKLEFAGEATHYEAIYYSDEKETRRNTIKIQTKKIKSHESDKKNKKRTTRKVKYESLLEKINKFYEKVEQYIPRDKKNSISDEFQDIQIEIVSMISKLELSRSISSSSKDSVERQKKMDELNSLKTIFTMVSKKDKPEIRKRIQELELQI